MSETALMRTGEVENYLGVDRRTLYRFEEAGLLRCVKLGNQRFWIRKSVMRIFDEGVKHQEGK